MTADHCLLELLNALAPTGLALCRGLGLQILHVQKRLDLRLALGLELLRKLASDHFRGAVHLLEAEVHLMAAGCEGREQIAELLLKLRNDPVLKGDHLLMMLAGLVVEFHAHAIFERTELRPVLCGLRSGLDALCQAVLCAGYRVLHLLEEDIHYPRHIHVGRKLLIRVRLLTLHRLHLAAQDTVLHLLQHFFELNGSDADPTTRSKLSFHVLLLAVRNHVWHLHVHLQQLRRLIPADH
mmetsp:Transcript_34339/g.98551  ORF Transcript_34339/g.98551 Transcript_34339/m.98551 type:complete len:239 (+) Transcript_34339:701-1417(+)